MSPAPQILWTRETRTDLAGGVVIARVTATLDPIRLPRKRTRRGPMLAGVFEEMVDGLPVFAQPKLNGVRCIASASGLFTRGGRKITSLPHIEHKLARLFLHHPKLRLDGEIYCHGMSLGKISGAVRSHAPTVEGSSLDLHIFDMIGRSPFEIRFKKLKMMVGEHAPQVPLVETSPCDDTAQIDKHYRRCLARGFEGQMIRDPDASYIHGRTDVLLKRKPSRQA